MPVRDRKVESFDEAIAAQLSDTRGASDVVAVFKTLDNRISEGEIRDVKAGLPKAICNLWPE